MGDVFEEVTSEILFTFIECLDMFLTQKNVNEVRHTSKGQRKSVEDFVFNDSIYYLSDGGYSRLYFRIIYDDNSKQEKVSFVLGSESRTEVKLRWHGLIATKLRKEILDFLTAFVAFKELQEEEA